MQILTLSLLNKTQCQLTLINHLKSRVYWKKSRRRSTMFVTSRIQSSVRILSKTAKRQVHNTSYLLKNKLDEVLSIDVNGENLKFPYVWLRDNCQCDKCFHYSAKSRTIDWSGFNVNIKPKETSQVANIVHITWEDGHKTNYNVNWLKFRSFTQENQKKYTESIYKPSKITWKGDEFAQILSKHDYNDILKCDEALYNWLEKLSVYGVALIQNAPEKDTAVDSIVEKIGFTRRTHYGVKFVVQNVANTSNVAYLSSNLQMHTDLPYYEYCPGVNLLHCLVQTRSKGGENLLSDCHFVANYMKENHLEEFKLLTRTEVEWSDVGVENGNEFFKLYRSPIVCLDRHEEITRINFSVPQRGSHFPGPIAEVKPWYEAHSLFYELNHKFAARFKTTHGDILTFDNIRLLHGRNAYEDKENNTRKLIGAYIDWDEIYSKLRCLKVKLRNKDDIHSLI